MAARVGRVLLFAVALLCLVAPVVLVAHPISYVPLISVLLVLGVSWAYLRVVRRSLSIDVSGMAGECERGSTTPLVVTLSNGAPFPCARISLDFYVTDLFGGYDSVRTFTCSARAREDLSLGIDVRFAHVGTYYAGVSSVVVYDLLGLFHATLDEGSRRQVTVRPRRMQMGEAPDLLAAPDESRRALKPVAADDLDYSSVREYRYGDPLKTVHWNLSARDPGGALYTRLYETYVNPTLTIVIDSCSPDYGTEDLMSLMDGIVETAVELSRQARLSGVEAEVLFQGRDGEPGTAHLVTVSDACSLVSDMRRICPEGSVDADPSFASDALLGACLSPQGSGNVALVTSRVDPGQIETLAEASMARRNAMAFVAVPRSLAGRDRDSFLAPMRRVSEAGGSWWTVESNEVATEVSGL